MPSINRYFKLLHTLFSPQFSPIPFPPSLLADDSVSDFTGKLKQWRHCLQEYINNLQLFACFLPSLQHTMITFSYQRPTSSLVLWIPSSLVFSRHYLSQLSTPLFLCYNFYYKIFYFHDKSFNYHEKRQMSCLYFHLILYIEPNAVISLPPPLC